MNEDDYGTRAERQKGREREREREREGERTHKKWPGENQLNKGPARASEIQ